MKNLHIVNPFFNSPVIYFDTVSSTMDTARSLYPKELPGGSVIVAGYQSAGRGRGRNRRWVASKGSSLLFTLITEVTSLGIPVSHVPVAAGLGICRFLEGEFNVHPCIKWPNDILVQERKICGILCELSGNVLYTGIGLNCNQSEYHRFSDLNIEATSLSLETGEPSGFNPRELLPGLLPALHSAFLPDALEISWLPEAEKRLYMRNSVVRVRRGAVDSEVVEEARILGLSHEGGLRLENSSGEEYICLTGEILYPGISY